MSNTIKSKKNTITTKIPVSEIESIEKDFNKKLSDIMFTYQCRIDELNYVISEQNRELSKWNEKFDNIMRHVYNKKYVYCHELVLSPKFKIVKSNDIDNPKFGVYEHINDVWTWKAAFPTSEDLIDYLYNKMKYKF